MTSTTDTVTKSRRPAVDATCAAAIDLARAALEESTDPGEVGEHLGVRAEADRLVTHFFASTAPAYRGWQWAVSVGRASRSREVTVNESVLLPGPEAVLAPEWVPWSERLRPGDLGVGDLLPTREDDERLVPGYTGADDAPDADPSYADVAWELGLGRERVLSPWGRDDAAGRWYEGEHGPSAPIAEAAPAKCSTCGFLVSVGGPLGQLFGLCANEFSPSDGHVVSFDHGCGAHSEVAVLPKTPEVTPAVVDEVSYDAVPDTSS
jgi:hypothetical protein